MVAMDTETWNGSRSPILHKKAVFESKLFSCCALVL